MNEPVKFKLNPREDLSERPDFTFDLMQSISKEAQAAVDAAPEVVELKKKASVHVGVRGTLSSVEISVDVVRREGVELSDEEISTAKSAASQKIRESVGSRMTELLQRSIDSARGRM